MSPKISCECCGRIIFNVCRMVRRFYLKPLLFFMFALIFILFTLNWKFRQELDRLHNVTAGQIYNLIDVIESEAENTLIHDTWKNPDLENAAIFSAYLDMRPEVVLEEVPSASDDNTWALIRIIAIVDVSLDNAALTCYYKFSPSRGARKSTTMMLESPAVAVRIIGKSENFGMRYSAAFVLCKLITTDDGRLPSEVTFSSQSGKTFEDLGSIDFVEIHYTIRKASDDQDHFMSVCSPSLHHAYDKYMNLIEFVEYYRMMGVEHFTFYNTSISNDVSRVLNYYQNLNVASVIQWQIPARYLFERDLRYNGIFAAMNDCLYRSTMVQGYKYVVNVDLDEFIIPRKHDNFHVLMKYLDSGSDREKYATYIFRNMFFYLMYEDKPIAQNQSDIPKLLLHSKTTRLIEINPAYSRSKYIIRGQDVIEMGNHRVFQTRKTSLVFRTSFNDKIVDPDIAASHHYRSCEVNELVCWLRETMEDTTAHKFTGALGKRVAAVLKEIFPEKN